MQNKTSTPRRERRALSHVGGRITLTGSDEQARSVLPLLNLDDTKKEARP